MVQIIHQNATLALATKTSDGLGVDFKTGSAINTDVSPPVCAVCDAAIAGNISVESFNNLFSA